MAVCGDLRPSKSIALFAFTVNLIVGAFLLPAVVNSTEQKSLDRRLLRWALQSAARELMSSERVSWCLRRIGFDPETRKGFGSVKVMYSERVQRAHYKNLLVCASVWMCALCAPKVSERRRIELTEAVANAPYEVVLVTFTLQHDYAHSLDETLSALLSAYRQLKSGRAWAEFEKIFGVVGSVRALEVMYGRSGWHPHLHVLFFVKPPCNLEGFRQFLTSRWLAVLKKIGRFALWQYGVDVQMGNTAAADYLAKWGHETHDEGLGSRWTVEHEMVKGVSKLARGSGGVSMLGLLELFLYGDTRAGQLWKEYATCFKGKHQLSWSRGLRALLGLDDPKSDLELAQAVEEDASLLVSLSLHQWRKVLGNDARGELLEVASSGNVEAVNEFLIRIGAGLLNSESVVYVVPAVSVPSAVNV